MKKTHPNVNDWPVDNLCSNLHFSISIEVCLIPFDLIKQSMSTVNQSVGTQTRASTQTSARCSHAAVGERLIRDEGKNETRCTVINSKNTHMNKFMVVQLSRQTSPQPHLFTPVLITHTGTEQEVETALTSPSSWIIHEALQRKQFRCSARYTGFS